MSKQTQQLFFQIQKLKYLKNQQKKGDFENPKVQNHDFSTKLVPDQCGFPNSAVCWEPKYGTNRGPPVVWSEMCVNTKHTAKIESTYLRLRLLSALLNATI